MTRMAYSTQFVNQIIDHEDDMLSMYAQKIQEYIPSFQKLGYSLRLGLLWINPVHKCKAFSRIKYQNGYQCYVYCSVQKNGEDVTIANTDGEAEYYPLSAEWMISSISRRWFRLIVSFYKSVDDVDEDLQEFLFHLNRM